MSDLMVNGPMANHSIFLIICCIIFLTGCTAPSPVSSPSQSATHHPDVTDEQPILDSTTTPSPFASQRTAHEAGTQRVLVTEVVDGDTITIQYRNGTTDTVRLLGIDAPEIRAQSEPAEFEGVPVSAAGKECLRDAGQNAADYLNETLAGQQVELEFDELADRRGYYDRLLAYVYVDSTNINHRLVVLGHARVYESAFTERDRFYAAETRAQREQRNLWQCTTL